MASSRRSGRIVTSGRPRSNSSADDPLRPDKRCWNWVNPRTGNEGSFYSMLSPDELSRRPKWEPVVQRAAWKIEQNPHLEEAALRSLERQGCQSPIKHYSNGHECAIYEHRLSCLRAIASWQQNRKLIQAIAERLPKELSIQILEYVVISTSPLTTFVNDRTLGTAAIELIGVAPSGEYLLPLAEQALLEQSIFSVCVDFQRVDNQRLAILPPSIFGMPHPLRHLQLTLDFEIPIGRQKYPATIYTATAGMPSLLSQLPGLRSLHLFMRIELTRPPWDHRGSALDVGCRKGFSGTSTFRSALEELIEAVKIARPNLEVYLELKYVYEGTWRGEYQSLPATYDVEMGELTATELVEGADLKWQNCRFSQGWSRVTFPTEDFEDVAPEGGWTTLEGSDEDEIWWEADSSLDAVVDESMQLDMGT